MGLSLHRRENCTQDRSPAIHEKRTNDGSWNTGEEAVLSVIERVKVSIAMRSEKPVEQGVLDNVKIGIAYLGNDDCTRVCNEVHFQTPPTKVAFYQGLHPLFRFEIVLTNTVLHPTACLVDTRAGPNLVIENYMKSQTKFGYKRMESPKLKAARKGQLTSKAHYSLRHGWESCLSNLVQNCPEPGIGFLCWNDEFG